MKSEPRGFKASKWYKGSNPALAMRQKNLNKEANQVEDGQKEKLTPSSQKTSAILPSCL